MNKQKFDYKTDNPLDCIVKLKTNRRTCKNKKIVGNENNHPHKTLFSCTIRSWEQKTKLLFNPWLTRLDENEYHENRASGKSRILKWEKLTCDWWVWKTYLEKCSSPLNEPQK